MGKAESARPRFLNALTEAANWRQTEQSGRRLTIFGYSFQRFTTAVFKKLAPFLLQFVGGAIVFRNFSKL
jgi:hypothetical protein